MGSRETLRDQNLGGYDGTAHTRIRCTTAHGPVSATATGSGSGPGSGPVLYSYFYNHTDLEKTIYSCNFYHEQTGPGSATCTASGPGSSSLFAENNSTCSSTNNNLTPASTNLELYFLNIFYLSTKCPQVFYKSGIDISTTAVTFLTHKGCTHITKKSNSHAITNKFPRVIIQMLAGTVCRETLGDHNPGGYDCLDKARGHAGAGSVTGTGSGSNPRFGYLSPMVTKWYYNTFLRIQYGSGPSARAINSTVRGTGKMLAPSSANPDTINLYYFYLIDLEKSL